MNKKRLYFGLALLISFLLLTILIPTQIFNSFDLSVTKVLQFVVPRSFDLPFSLLSLIGSFELASILIIILWALYKRLDYFYVLIFFAIFHLLELIGKRFFEHPGPPAELVRYIFDFSFPSSGVKPGSSYPSGHMGRTAFISVLILAIVFRNKKLPKQKKLIFYFFVLIFNLLMFISRVYLGEHWLTDVMGGAILGVSMALFSLLL